MKKAIKIILAVIGIVLLLLVALVATLPLWLGPVVKPIANAAVPQITKTEFKLGHLSLNPYSGRFELGDVYLANPENYSEKCAASVGNFVLDVDMDTLTSDVIHIEEVTVENVFVSVAYDKTTMNFEQIQINAAGGEEAYRRKKAEKEAKAKADAEELRRIEASKTDEDREREEAEEALEELNSKKVVIDRFTLSGLKLKIGPVALPVPSITLKDIGKPSNGVTWAEAWLAITEAVMKSSGAVSDAFGKVGTAALDAGKGAIDTGTKGVNAAIESAKNLDLKGAEKTLKETGDALKKSGESLKGVGDSLKGLFK